MFVYVSRRYRYNWIFKNTSRVYKRMETNTENVKKLIEKKNIFFLEENIKQALLFLKTKSQF